MQRPRTTTAHELWLNWVAAVLTLSVIWAAAAMVAWCSS